MEAKIKKLILTLQNEIDSLSKTLEGISDSDYVGINIVHALIGEKEKTIERLGKL